MTPRRIIGLGTGTILALVAVVLATTSVAGQRTVPSSAGELAVLRGQSSERLSPQLLDGGQPSFDAGSVRTTQRGLGRFSSIIQVYTNRSGSQICYALLAQKHTDPGQSYCVEPKALDNPAALKGLHVSAIAPWSAMDGEPVVQIAGIAFDDVASVAVRIGTTTRSIPVLRNSFYLELPGVDVDARVDVEATLEDGTVQTLRVR